MRSEGRHRKRREEKRKDEKQKTREERGKEEKRREIYTIRLDWFGQAWVVWVSFRPAWVG